MVDTCCCMLKCPGENGAAASGQAVVHLPTVGISGGLTFV